MASKRKQQKIGARDLKLHLGEYIRAVRDGETIVVTERGEAVAELRPLPYAASEFDARVIEMAHSGELTLGSSTPLPPFRAVTVARRPLSRTLLDERADRI